MHYILAIIFLFISCGKAKPEPKPSPVPPSVLALYEQASHRLTSEFLLGGFVMSRNAQGLPEHAGDSLLWSGLALAALPCTEGDVIEDALVAMVIGRNGALVRFEPIDEAHKGNEISFDGAAGFYRGVADRIKRCPGSDNKWRPAIALHVKFLEENHGALFPGSTAILPPGFDFLPRRLGFSLGVASDPDVGDLHTAEGLVAAWALGVQISHSAAYRVNLGLITLQTAESLGFPTNRDKFCAATRGMGLMTVEQFCGRSGLPEFINAWQYDRLEYQFQRATWETETPEPGMRFPGVDLLTAVKQVYSL